MTKTVLAGKSRKAIAPWRAVADQRESFSGASCGRAKSTYSRS
jgi:hypothetical protein